MIPELAARLMRPLSVWGIEIFTYDKGMAIAVGPNRLRSTGSFSTAAPLEIPDELIDELAAGGRLVAPVGGNCRSATGCTR